MSTAAAVCTPRARMLVEARLTNGATRCGAYESSTVAIGRMAQVLLSPDPVYADARRRAGVVHYTITIAQAPAPGSSVRDHELYDLIGMYLDPVAGIEQAELAWASVGQTPDTAPDAESGE